MPSIVGDAPQFNLGLEPSYIVDGKSVNRGGALRWIAENYGDDVQATAYNATSIFDEQDTFVLIEFVRSDGETIVNAERVKMKYKKEKATCLKL